MQAASSQWAQREANAYAPAEVILTLGLGRGSSSWALATDPDLEWATAQAISQLLHATHLSINVKTVFCIALPLAPAKRHSCPVVWF
ncbi:MAG: hypothetical protein M0Z88_07345 [Actinomycetota bacterium]|nr:hypothetical protein [Actinomycetota bacterium]